jgi:hypothetical protein
MGDYGLRSCFLPDLSGLHLRIYQFKTLLKQHVPKVAAHLEELHVEGEYLTQWFLSFFAVTCPLPLLFRIYDVLFAEGASETIMRVALAIVQRNERKILSYDEFDDVMQLLLSRQLWDVYGLSPASADQFVQNFVSFTHLVTRDNLDSLEAEFRERQAGHERRPSTVAPNTSNAAKRFLGRLWTGAPKMQPAPSQHQTQRQQSLSPDDVPNNAFRPKAPLRQNSNSSLRTISSNEGTSDASVNISTSTSSTALTDYSLSTHASADSVRSSKAGGNVLRSSRNTSNKERELEAQIEGLLMMISEMQKNHAVIENQLQKSTEDWHEDTVAIRTFLEQVKADVSTSTSAAIIKKPFSRRASEASPVAPNMAPVLSQTSVRLMHSLDRRFTTRSSRRSTDLVTKEELRSTLAATKDQLQAQTQVNKEMERQIESRDQESSLLRNELQIARSRIKDAHFDKQRLEKTILELKHSKKHLTSSRPTSRYNTIEEEPEVELRESSDPPPVNPSGLREFRLGRNSLTRSNNSSTSNNSNTSSTSFFAKRTSSLPSNPPSNIPSPIQENAPSLFSQASSPTSTAPPSLASSRAPTSANIHTMRSAASSSTSLASSAYGALGDSNDKLLMELATAKTNEAVTRQELDELRTRFDSMRRMMTSVAGSFPPSPASHGLDQDNKNPFGMSIGRSMTGTSGGGSVASAMSTPASTPGGQPLSAVSSVGSNFGTFWWGRK